MACSRRTVELAEEGEKSEGRLASVVLLVGAPEKVVEVVRIREGTAAAEAREVLVMFLVVYADDVVLARLAGDVLDPCAPSAPSPGSEY